MTAPHRKRATAPPTTLDDLPMFASDEDIATALVGKDAASKWLRERLPVIQSKPGFPPIDDFHGGRPVPLVKRFYENYLGLPADGHGKPDGREDENAWRKPRHRA